MSSSRSNAQDRRELERITRFFALKVAQVIVQSRRGQKVKTQCKPNSSGADWFNLAIEDSAELLAETKRSMQADLTSSPVPLCIEVSVKTVEGQSTALETWCLRAVKEQGEFATRVTNTVIYNRMGMLLKSLLSVTRMTPAYKISRRQSAESYVLRYRIFMGEPQTNNLGDHSKHARIGNVDTELGAIHLSVSYRTWLTFSPSRRSPDNISLKSDHFEADESSPNARKEGTSDAVKAGAFAEDRRTSVSEDTDEDIPFGSLLSIGKSPSPSIADQDATRTPEIAADTCDGNEPPPRNSSSCSLASANEFIMVDLKSPFAVTNANNDLGTFYRECHSAPTLQNFEGDMTLEEQIGDLTKQLEGFEVNMQVFDDFVDSLCKEKNKE